ncbi:MAG: methyltransferase domain-containing protein [Bacteroidota bacterium]
MFRFLLNTLPRPLLIRLSYVFRLVAPFLYRGDAVECPVCKNSFSKFLPYGSKVALRENVLCPHCLSLERHRLLWLYLNQRTNFFIDNLDVMHIAPEQCFYGPFKKLKNINYYTGDLVSPLAEYHFDLHEIPFEDNKFDVVICNHVMEHVDDDLQCMRELYRILKPGGWAIMQVPIDYSREETYEDSTIVTPEDREKHFWQKDHVRLFGRDYGKRLSKAGFDVKEDRFVEEIDPELREKFRLQDEEIIYFLSKEKGTQI